MLAESIRPVYASGECEIDLVRRELRVAGSPVPLGGRAFEIIEVLAQSAGELVTKDELMNRIWPGAAVMESTLHVHAGALRKALGPYRELLKTEYRRGYRLLGAWSVRRRDATGRPAGLQQRRVSAASPATNFPPVSTRLIGRAAAVRRLRDLLSAYRVVTLTGPGGIGKSSLALKVARGVLSTFEDGGWLVELASVADPHLVASALAGVLGLRLETNVISAEAVARAIAGRNLLLVLDNCEHVIDAAASLAEMIVRFSPRTTVLATSREVLRIAGEHAYRVPPLDVPAIEQRDAEQILGHSAAELFIARARELGSELRLDADGLRAIAAICRQLDGIPLAIEFAAARTAGLGIEELAAGLHDRFVLLTSGRRTALPRHQTLRATLDWSYHLLTDAERVLLQRLAVFAGSFSLEDAIAVTNRGAAPDADITEGVVNLVAKSLVASDVTGDAGRFRLLETIRVYALAKLTESGELQEFSRRHAEHYRGLLDGTEYWWERRSTHLAHIDNARAALEWCFGAHGSLTIGVALAAAAAPAFLAMSLLHECHRWSERAILALDESNIGGADEMHLQASLGVASMQMRGQSDAARVALSRGLAIAETRGDVLSQVGLLGMLSMFDVRDGDFNTSLHYAQLSRAVNSTAEGSAAMALANSILGRALQFVGDHGASRVELEASFRYWSQSRQTSEVHLGLDHHILVGIGLARNRWLQGYPAQAAERLRQTIKDAESKSHPASLGLALSWAPEIFLWLGDRRSAEDHADWLLSHADYHSLRPYLAVARGYKSALAIDQGDARAGVEGLRVCLEQLHAMRYRMFNTEFKLSLVQGLVAIGANDEGLALIDETIALVEANGDLIHMPEALRVKGRVLLAMPQARAEEAEAGFIQSLEWSRRQAARSWQLRTAVDLAALWAARGQSGRARAVLRPIFDAFGEGRDTADLKAAVHLLATLR